MVTDMYALPVYGTVDPNPLMAPFFILFYGIMMADMGYGILMVLGAIFMMKKMRPKGGMRNFAELLFYFKYQSAYRQIVALLLLKDKGLYKIIDETYNKCKEELKKPKGEMRNCVRDIYKPFTVDEINRKIIEMLRPDGMTTPVELVFQSIEGLHEAIPAHKGDWYFTGNYPTPGGVKLVNQAFVRFVENVYKYERKF